MDRALYLSAVKGVSVSGNKVGIAVNRDDIAIRILFDRSAFHDITAHKAHLTVRLHTEEFGRRYFGKIIGIDIKLLAETVEKFQNGTLEDVKGFCAVATTEEIGKQDYILTPGRYVGIEEQEDDGEPFEEKMARLTSELSEMFAKSHELEDEIREKLGAIGYEI